VDQFPPPRTLGPGQRGLLRRRRVQLGVVVAGLAVAAAVVAVVLSSDSASAKAVRLDANSIAVIDPKTGRAVGDVRLGFAPTDVVAGGNQIWVLNKRARTVTAIDPKTLHLYPTIGLSGDPVSQYSTGDTDWVVRRGAVDKVTTDGVTTIALWKPLTPVTNPIASPFNATCQPFVTGNPKSVWVSEVRHLAVFDATTGTLVRRSTLPVASAVNVRVYGPPSTATCYGVRYANNELLAVRDPDEAIGRLDPDTGDFLPILTGAFTTNTGFDSKISPWTAGFGNLWVPTTELVISTVRTRASVISYDLRSGQQTGKTAIGTVAGAQVGIYRFGGPQPLTVDPATGVWALAFGRNALIRIDPSTDQPRPPVPLHHVSCCVDTFANAIAAGHGRIWVALQSP